MKMNLISIHIFCVFLVINCFFSPNESTESMSYSITKLWDNQTIEVNEKIDLEFQYKDTTNNSRQRNLWIKVFSPFYNDPKIPDNTPKGSMNKLWDYEVVEIFLLGSDDHYLEIELGPKGQYLLLSLHGSKNVSENGLPLDYFNPKIDGNKWSGVVVIPFDYLPNNLTKFNAYAIHGSDPHRRYLSLFPTPFGEYKDPDFHRLEYFGEFDLR